MYDEMALKIAAMESAAIEELSAYPFFSIRLESIGSKSLEYSVAR